MLQKTDTLADQVGRYLKCELRRRGITQEEFGEQIGVSDRTIRRWVSGDIHSLESVGEIAQALQVPVRDIFLEDVFFLAENTDKRTRFVLFFLLLIHYPSGCEDKEGQNEKSIHCRL